jgi:PAS domain S-box-containing protein
MAEVSQKGVQSLLDALTESEERFRATFELGPAAIAHTAPDGAWLLVNEAFCRLLGYSREELFAIDSASVTHPDDVAESQRITHELLQGHGAVAAFDKRYLRRDGSIAWASLATKLVRHADGHPKYFVTVAIDETARRAAEARAKQLGDLNAALTSINAALVRAGSRDEILQQVCRIAVEVGGFTSAAVFLRDPELPIASVVAMEGAERAFVTGIRARLDASPLSAGTVGVSIVASRPDVCNDIEHDPRMAPWRDHATAHGMRSSASFPLRQGGRTIGCLLLLAREPHYFHADQVHLLNAMAEDASYALDALATGSRLATSEFQTRESEARFRELVEQSHDVVFFFDTAGRITFVNSASARVFGRRPEEMIGRSFTDFTPDEQHSRDADLMARLALREDGLAEQRARILRANGTIGHVMVNVKARFGPDGVLVGFRGIARDVSDRQAATERIAELSSLLDQATDAITLRTLDDEILFWSGGAERMYGWSSSEALGSNALALLQNDRTAYVEARHAVEQSGAWSGELVKVRRDGSRVTVECRWSAMRDADGRIAGVLAIDTDITERKKLERQFLRAQRLESLGTLAGGIAHDLNNVLTPVLLTLDLLRGRLGDDAETLELLATLESSARRGAALVRQVLNFARGADGKYAAVDLRHVVRETQALLRETLPRNIAVAVRMEANLPTVSGDPTELHQVLMNLCVNARDAMPRGGRLSLSLSTADVDAATAARHAGASAGRYIVLQVQDSGTGIAAETLERIFEPFFTTKEVGRGTGLGLSTAIGIVQRHRGFITVYSEVGTGTTFHIYLPETSDGSANPSPSVPVRREALPRGNGELILVADDESDIRDTATRVLTAFGYRVLAAENGAEAVSRFVEHRAEIAVVLTDMAMPVMDGPATIVALRAIDPAVRIIGSSGRASNGGVAKAIGAGVSHFLAKPYTAERLLTELHDILSV